MPAGPGVAGGRAAGDGSQLGRIPADVWAALLADAKARARVHQKVYRRGPGQCHCWLGALTSTGHGRVRLGVRALRAGAVVLNGQTSWGIPAGEAAERPAFLPGQPCVFRWTCPDCGQVSATGAESAEPGRR
jgi:hypothetical protein